MLESNSSGLRQHVIMEAPMTTTTMAAVSSGVGGIMSSSTGSVSLTRRLAALLGSEENAIRILFSLLLGWLFFCVYLYKYSTPASMPYAYQDRFTLPNVRFHQ